MRAAIYARVSMQDQHCEVQLRELRAYAKNRGWRPTEYVDAGVSGAKASRPELDRLMRDASEKQLDLVLVTKIDRFGRSVLNLAQQLGQLGAYGVRFMAITQGIDTDASNPASRLLLHILAAVAEFERELIRERTHAGLARARAAGKVLGRPRRVFRRDRVTELRAQGMSWRMIARNMGVPLMTIFDAAKSCSPLPAPRPATRPARPTKVRPDTRTKNAIRRRARKRAK